MSEKQDRTGVRTAAQLEQKYSFGKKFSEIIGLIDESRNEVDSAMSRLNDKITETSTTLSRTTEAVEAQAKKVTELADGVAKLSNEVEMKLDAESFSIAVQQEIANGVDRVVTATGYIFDADGLKIHKQGEALESQLDNTGLLVQKSGIDVLVANNKGVVATDLTANNYLIIGNSRFEDYQIGRTGCFYVGI